jgi:hypothetical protein
MIGVVTAGCQHEGQRQVDQGQSGVVGQHGQRLSSFELALVVRIRHLPQARFGTSLRTQRDTGSGTV